MTRIDVPVLIVGGGGAGLTASMLLSQLGVETLLVSALPTTSVLPKAHVLNQRAMEIFTDVGVAAEIYRRGTPPEEMRYSAYYVGLAGPDPAYGRQLGRMESWGGGGLDLDWAAASACRQTNLPQIRLEPILKARAEALAPGRIKFNTELLDLEQDADGVTAMVRDKTAGTDSVVRARYLLACDAGRTVGRKLGVELQGARDVMRIVSVYMTADLSRWARDPDVLIRWLWVPRRGALATLVPMGPDHWGPQSEEWVFHLNYENDDTRAIDDAQVIADMKDTLGLPDLDAEVHVISRWAFEAILADRFQVGRVFMVGDAAHRHPPTGGLGLTSAVHDAHNLCWKLAAVLAGHAGEDLLATYEAERRPVDGRNVQRSMENGMNHVVVGQAMGFERGASAEDEPGRPQAGARRRAGGRRAPPARARGDRYAIDGVPRAQRRIRPAVYFVGDHRRRHARAARARRHPTLRPEHATGSTAAPCRGRGSRRRPPRPHEPRAAGAVPPDRRRRRWPLVRPPPVSSPRPQASRSRAVRIGHLDGDYRDPRCTWLRHRQIGPQGAVLIRPDRFVAWRSTGASANPRADLGAALARILCRPIA